MKSMMFLRHGHAAPSEFGIDLIRNLSEKGRAEACAVIFPKEPAMIISSPANRAMETARLSTGKEVDVCISELYAAILLPEVAEMYEKKGYGDDARKYFDDPESGKLKEIMQKAADMLRDCPENTIVVSHSVVTNFLIYALYGIEEVMDIPVNTGHGIYVTNNGELIEF